MAKKRLSMVIGFIALLVVGGAVYLYMLISEAGDRWPSLNTAGSLTQQVNQLDRDVQNLKAEVAKIPAMEERLAKVRIDFELASRVLPRESSPDQLIAAIRTKAQQAGVAPSSLRPSVSRAAARRSTRNARGGGGPSGSFETWTFSLTLQGSYDQIASFVNRMEEFDSADAAQTGSEKRFFELIDIDISAEQSGLANLGPNSGGNPIMHNCNITMRTYRYTGE